MASGDAPIEIVSYDPCWPARFADEANELRRGLAAWLAPACRTHHPHLVPVGSPQWIGPIAFRDYLRRHKTVATEYEALKRDLAQQHPFDREAYTEAKQPFITRVTDVALAEGYGT
jgi:GrpB-like predicted nucleotidyltransferase (UPF0157 family)